MFESCSINDWLFVIGGAIVVCCVILGGAVVFKIGVNWIIRNTEGGGKGYDGHKRT